MAVKKDLGANSRTWPICSRESGAEAWDWALVASPPPLSAFPACRPVLNFLRVFDGAVDQRGGNIKNCGSFFKMLYKILLVIPYVPFRAGLME